MDYERLAELLFPEVTLTPAELEDYSRYANRAAAITVSRPGAIPAMPTSCRARSTAALSCRVILPPWRCWGIRPIITIS